MHSIQNSEQFKELLKKGKTANQPVMPPAYKGDTSSSEEEEEEEDNDSASDSSQEEEKKSSPEGGVPKMISDEAEEGSNEDDSDEEAQEDSSDEDETDEAALPEPPSAPVVVQPVSKKEKRSKKAATSDATAESHVDEAGDKTFKETRIRVLNSQSLTTPHLLAFSSERREILRLNSVPHSNLMPLDPKTKQVLWKGVGPQHMCSFQRIVTPVELQKKHNGKFIVSDADAFAQALEIVTARGYRPQVLPILLKPSDPEPQKTVALNNQRVTAVPFAQTLVCEGVVRSLAGFMPIDKIGGKEFIATLKQRAIADGKKWPKKGLPTELRNQAHQTNNLKSENASTAGIPHSTNILPCEFYSAYLLECAADNDRKKGKKRAAEADAESDADDAAASAAEPPAAAAAAATSTPKKPAARKPAAKSARKPPGSAAMEDSFASTIVARSIEEGGCYLNLWKRKLKQRQTPVTSSQLITKWVNSVNEQRNLLSSSDDPYAFFMKRTSDKVSSAIPVESEHHHAALNMYRNGMLDAWAGMPSVQETVNATLDTLRKKETQDLDLE